MNGGRTLALVLFLGLGWSRSGSAHTLSRSSSTWRFDGARVEVVVRYPVLEIARRRAGVRPDERPESIARSTVMRSWLGDYLSKRVRPLDGSCRAQGSWSVRSGSEGSVLAAATFECTARSRPEVVTDLFDGSPNHIHLITVEHRDRSFEGVATSALRVLRFDPDDRLASAHPAQFAWAGASHAAVGLDHLAFILGLVLLGGRATQVLGALTGFTFGHGLALAAAASGLIEPEAVVVEALVALSVGYMGLQALLMGASQIEHRWILGANLGLHALAAAALWRVSPLAVGAIGGSACFCTCHLLRSIGRPSTLQVPVVLALTFGLVHGLAFASGFAELESATSLAGSLISFHLGIEVVQFTAASGLLLLFPPRARNLGDVRYLMPAAFVLACGTFFLTTHLT